MLARSHFASEAEYLEALRNWFAGQALTGLVVRGPWTFSDVAEKAYGYADAMLTKRDPQ